MDRRQINALTDIDIPSLRLEDIRFLFGTGMGMTKGRGRDKEKFFRKGVQTEIGDIREDVWYQLAEQVIGLHGETWLLEALETWYREMKHYPRHGFDVHKMALELHSNRIFDSEGWIDISASTGAFGRRCWRGDGSPKSGWIAVRGRYAR